MRILFKIKINQLFPVFVIIAWLFCNSCEDEFIHGQVQTRAISVNGFLPVNDTFRINVSHVKSLMGYTKDSFIFDANPRLILPDGSIHPLVYHDNPDPMGGLYFGFYRSNSIIEHQNGLYTLEVALPNGVVLRALDSVPEVVDIISADLLFDPVSKKYSIHLEFIDPLYKTNYYSVSLNSKSFIDNWYFSRDNYPIYSHTTFVEFQSDWLPLSQIIFSNVTFKDSKQFVNLEISENLLNSLFETYDSTLLYVQLHSISKAYYDYAISFYKQKLAEKDFYAEPVMVFSNIEGGYGIFAGYSTSEKIIKYVKE